MENPVQLSRLIPLRELFKVLNDNLVEKERLFLSLMTSINKRILSINPGDGFVRRMTTMSIGEQEAHLTDDELTIILRVVEVVFDEAGDQLQAGRAGQAVPGGELSRP
jgi:hypothetical protein